MPYSVLEQLEASDKPLDVKRVAAIFGMTGKKVRQMVDTKEIPSYRMGVTIQFDPSALSYWLRRQDPTFALARREAVKSTT